MATIVNESVLDSLDHVDASLDYLAHMAERPVNYMYKVPAGQAQTSRRFNPQVMRIRNGRPLVRKLSLDREGFLLLPHATAVSNFYDQHEVRNVYYPEIERLLKAVTGAEKVVVFDATLRNRPGLNTGDNGVKEPVRAAHNDYTVKSGPQRVRDLLEPAEAEARLKHRFAEINVWRPIRGPLQDSPLAVCDATSIAPEDLVETEQRYRNRTGEIYSITYNPNHRWFYFPNLQSDEVLLIKGYDSDEDGTARFTAHTSFQDPTAPPDAVPRESIEIRALVFFAPQPDG